MTIWANHAHVFPPDVRPNGSIDELLRLMDGCDIEKVVAFAPFSEQVRGHLAHPNEWLANEIAKRPSRLLGFGTIDLAAGQVGKQVEQIHDLGLRGIKLHPAFQRFHILSEPLLEVYAATEAAGLFITFHTGVHWHRLKDFRLIDFDDIANQFPRLCFSLEHVGGYAFYREAVGVIQNNSHRQHPGGLGTVYAGLTTVFYQRAPHWYLSPAAIEELVFLVGEGRIIFGLDFPYNDLKDTRDAIAIIQGLNIPTAAKEAILGGNLRTVLSHVGQAVAP